VVDKTPSLWKRLWGSAKQPMGHTATTLGDGVVVDGRFAIRRLLGIGGTSAVYVAEQTSMGRDVALKILRSELLSHEQATDRFLREVRAVARLTNPHTISVYDVGITDNGLLFIAMELLRGRPLFQLMTDEHGPLSPWRAVSLVDQICDSLAEAHAAGVLHRDLKPENIFVVESPTAKEFAKVLDFGIAQLGDEADVSVERKGMVVGTPRYMSPEQMAGRPLDARSDLYSLATVLFELVTSQAPFEAPTPLALALRKTREDAPTLASLNLGSRIPHELGLFLAQALSRNPDDRPSNASEFKALLDLAMDGVPPDPDRPRGAVPTGPLPAVKAPPPLPPPPPPAKTGDRRAAPRQPRTLKVRFKHDGVEHAATTTDTSRTGAFLASRFVPPVGARIEVAHESPGGGGAVARTWAEVVRIIEQPAPPSGVRGFGIRWLQGAEARPSVSVEDLVPPRS
jgi:eukaryotic-like serine/threonine-protein kinase